MTVKELQYYQHLLSHTDDLDPGIESLFGRFFERTLTVMRDKRRSLLALKAAKSIDLNRRAFLKVIDRTIYLDIAGVEVPVPEGLTVNYRTLLSAILQGSQHSVSLREELLTPFKELLTGIINSSSIAYSADPLKNSLRARQVKMNAYQDQLRGMFDRTGRSYVPYGQVIERNADWPELLDMVATLTNKDAVGPEDILQDVEEISSYLAALVEMIRAKELAGMSPAIQRQLVDMASSVANEVSFVASVFYYREGAVNAIDDTVRQLIKSFQ